MNAVTETREMTALERKWAEESANREPKLTDAYSDSGKLETEKIRPPFWSAFRSPRAGGS